MTSKAVSSQRTSLASFPPCPPSDVVVSYFPLELCPHPASRVAPGDRVSNVVCCYKSLPHQRQCTFCSPSVFLDVKTVKKQPSRAQSSPFTPSALCEWLQAADRALPGFSCSKSHLSMICSQDGPKSNLVGLFYLVFWGCCITLMSQVTQTPPKPCLFHPVLTLELLEGRGETIHSLQYTHLNCFLLESVCPSDSVISDPNDSIACVPHLSLPLWLFKPVGITERAMALNQTV